MDIFRDVNAFGGWGLSGTAADAFSLGYSSASTNPTATKGRGHLRIVEHGRPFSEGQVRGDRRDLVEFADGMEQQLSTDLRDP